MTLVLLFYIIAPLVLTALMYRAGHRSWPRLLLVPVAFYALPVLVAGGVYFFRTPIQQGKTLAGLGPALNLFFPPEDLYVPLASAGLSAGMTQYTLRFTHRYVGHHAVEISVPGKAAFRQLETDLKVAVEVFEGGSMLFRNGYEKGSGFWGREDHGLHFVRYDVPGDLPVARPLTARISISGDLDGFLRGREGATLRITKVSDE